MDYKQKQYSQYVNNGGRMTIDQWERDGRFSLEDFPVPEKLTPEDLEVLQKLRSDMRAAIEADDFKNPQERSTCVAQYKVIRMALTKYYIHHKGLS